MKHKTHRSLFSTMKPVMAFREPRELEQSEDFYLWPATDQFRYGMERRRYLLTFI